VLNIIVENVLHVFLTKEQEVIQTLPASGPDPTLRVGVQMRRPWSDRNQFHTLA
jgi:hypothetical protein